ncbi:MAG TPA: hypothetical protein VKW78_01145 [Terriglobales bacterium]|jgi:hypothetical protein|nr:hypothetical protein [Terriglobales bacterium]
MARENQLDIKELGGDKFQIEFPFNQDYIDFIKWRVPAADRRYDEATKTWLIRGERYIGPLESVGMQRFRHVTRIFWRGSSLVIRNARTGTESIQGALF